MNNYNKKSCATQKRSHRLEKEEMHRICDGSFSRFFFRFDNGNKKKI